MKINHFLSAGMIALALSSCSSESAEELTNNQKFTVVSTIKSSTRAPQLSENGAGKFQDGDQNTLFFSNTSKTQQLSSFLYTYGQTYYWDGLGIPAETPTVNVAAIYPTVNTDTPKDFKWNVTASHDVKDVLLAPAVQVATNSASPVQLNFVHALHNLKIELSASGVDVSNETLKQTKIICRNFKSEAQINLLEGKVIGATGTAATVQTTGKSASFILPAQAVGTIEIELQLQNKNKVFRLADCLVNGESLKELKSGNVFTLQVEVSKNNGFVINGQSIAGWGNQGSYNGEFVL